MCRPKNFRQIPDRIIEKATKLKGKPVIVGCVKKLAATDITRGDYNHLVFSLKADKPEFPASVLPDPRNGRYSEWNANGHEIVRKDLPMVTKTFTVETPNYGDWSLGSHEVSHDREVYQRDFDSPRENEISIELLGQEAGAGENTYVFRFRISEVMDPKGQDFEDDLLFNVNLLQENVGAVDLFASDATVKDFLKTIYVNWEILPPGEREQNIARILNNVGDTPEIREKIRDRYTFFEKLKPEAFIQGHGGFERYFGAKFSDNLVVFENMQYGNAIYAMFTGWAEQSKRTKRELLSSGKAGSDFVRIPHLTEWKKTVEKLIKDRLGKK